LIRKDDVIAIYDIKSLKILQLNSSEKVLIVSVLLIFSMGLLGISFLNYHQNNNFILVFFILIAVALLLIYLLAEKIDKRIFPFLLYTISISLLLLLALRSNYFIGFDTHEEFHFFISALNNLKWEPQPGYLLSSAIDISILPTIYIQILNIDPVLLFKILISILFGIAPLVIYLIALQYMKQAYAFFISCFFMFQQFFLEVAANNRTSIGLLFFALAIYILILKDIDEFQRKVLFTIFLFSCVVSSYSTTFVFFFFLFACYLIITLISKFSKIKIKTNVSIVIILLFFMFIMLWYEQIINQVFQMGIQFSLNRIELFNDILKNDLLLNSHQGAGSSSLYTSIFSTIAKISRYILFGLIATGLCVSIIKYLPIPSINKKINNFLKFDIDLFYLMFSMICAVTFFILIFANSLFSGFGLDRLYQLLLVVLSLYLVIGLTLITDIKKIILIKIGKKWHFSEMKINLTNKKLGSVLQLLLVILLIIQLFDVAGITNQMAGYNNSIILNPADEKSYFGYNQAYVYNQEIFMGYWLTNYLVEANPKIIADSMEKRKMTSITNFESVLYSISITNSLKKEIDAGYIVLGPTNTDQQILLDDLGNPVPLNDYQYIIQNKPLIYNNGGEVFGKTI
jgi:uncharacterized membrane protein